MHYLYEIYRLNHNQSAFSSCLICSKLIFLISRRLGQGFNDLIIESNEESLS